MLMRKGKYRRIYRIHKLDEKREWVLALAFHMLVVGGVALAAAGSAQLQSTQQPPPDNAEKIAKAGTTILAISWAILVAWTRVSFTAPRAKENTRTHAGTIVSPLSSQQPFPQMLYKSAT